MSIELLITFIFLFVSHSIFLGIILHNLANAPKIERVKRNLNNEISVSVLIPARNEESNIGKLLDNLLQQTFFVNEIIILDDYSNDSTPEIVEIFRERDNRIKLFKGNELPDGWLGKNWACHQLAQHSNGDYLFFIDADVELDPHSIENALYKLFIKNVSMLSVFPTQKIKSLGEWIVVPLMNWLLLTFLPFEKVLMSKNENYVAANGQFILIKRKTYDLIGGHKEVKGNVVEDMELARAVKRKNEKVITCLGDQAISCRMYESFGDSLNGFSKNFYPGFKVSKFVFLILITLFLILFFVPLFLILVNSIFIVIILLIMLERIFVSIMSRQNWLLNLALHFIQMPIMYFLGIRSLFKKNILWKGRSI